MCREETAIEMPAGGVGSPLKEQGEAEVPGGEAHPSVEPIIHSLAVVPVKQLPCWPSSP